MKNVQIALACFLIFLAGCSKSAENEGNSGNDSTGTHTETETPSTQGGTDMATRDATINTEIEAVVKRLDRDMVPHHSKFDPETIELLDSDAKPKGDIYKSFTEKDGLAISRAYDLDVDDQDLLGTCSVEIYDNEYDEDDHPERKLDAAKIYDHMTGLAGEDPTDGEGLMDGGYKIWKYGEASVKIKVDEGSVVILID